MPTFTAAQIYEVFHTAPAEYVADFPVASLLALASLLAVVLTSAGLRVRLSADAHTHIVDTTANVRITAADLRSRVIASATDAAELASTSESPRAAHRGRNTLDMLRTRPRGSARYLESLLALIKDRLKEADAGEPASLEEARAKRSQTSDRTAYHADRYRSKAVPIADRRATEASAVIQRWIPTLGPGRHSLPDVWTAWNDVVKRASLDKVPAGHGARTIGKTSFYRALAEVAEVRTGGARRRVLVIPDQESTP